MDLVDLDPSASLVLSLLYRLHDRGCDQEVVHGLILHTVHMDLVDLDLPVPLVLVIFLCHTHIVFYRGQRLVDDHLDHLDRHILALHNFFLQSAHRVECGPNRSRHHFYSHLPKRYL